jgi:4-diphosphocytidyl-2-C-methyl-D-erythritol kinase
MMVAHELVRAPAKVNLFLRVRGQRADGYHLIDSLMAPISLTDQLRVAVQSVPHPHVRINVGTDSDQLPSGASNLAYRAADAFMAAAKEQLAVDVHIEKRIPIGGGLGGGSSDAAAVLLALNRMLGRPLEISQLADLGAAIGSDVPFFIHGGPARVGGVGEQIMPTSLNPNLDLVICTDGYPLSTSVVYSQLRTITVPALTSDPPLSNIAPFVEGRRSFTDLLVNDLEEAAARIHPAVLSLKAEIMGEGAQAALMTGSGSVVFGLWADPQSAVNAAARLRRRGLWAEAVRTLEVSPAVRN